jgi:hypothetical protein
VKVDQFDWLCECKIANALNERLPCWQQLIFWIMVFAEPYAVLRYKFRASVTRTLRSGKSAAAQLREFFLSEIAFKTPG